MDRKEVSVRWDFRCDPKCKPSCDGPLRGSSGGAQQCPSPPLSFLRPRTCFRDPPDLRFLVNNQFLQRPLVGESPRCPDAPLGYRQRVSAGIVLPGPSAVGVSQLVTPGNAVTLVLGPLASPTRIRSAELTYITETAAAITTGTFRCWLSETDVADTDPVGSDVDLTQRAVTFGVSDKPGVLLVAADMDWNRATLSVKIRVTAAAGMAAPSILFAAVCISGSGSRR